MQYILFLWNFSTSELNLVVKFLLTSFTENVMLQMQPNFVTIIDFLRGSNYSVFFARFFVRNPLLRGCSVFPAVTVYDMEEMVMENRAR